MGQSLDGMAAELGGLSETLDGIEDRIVCDAWHSERQALVDARRQLVVIHRQMATLTSLFRHLDHSHRNDLPDPINAWPHGFRTGRTRSITTANSCRPAPGCCRTR
ncbi:hypothetical protein AJ88_29370 [Mesorhizobium amorphae CCBAU 01583]|nr:hypothetical protein AJ88_29370 [Mesorhizobium amorphae CCBAU 01583]